jgi:ParB family chromosome partitioning protein
MSRKSGLGRGLDALIPGSESPPRSGVVQIPVDLIAPNPRQPRRNFDPGELSELADSMREHGVIQPLIVSNDRQREGYVLIAGERRLMAAREAGLQEVPAILREADDQQRLELALIENVQRADLNPLEAAEAFRQLSEDFNLSHEEIAARVGKSRTAVTNTLRLLKLEASVQQALINERIREGHARALLALPTHPAQEAALKVVLDRDLTVRQTEELVRKLSGQKPSPRPKPAPEPEIVALEERLRASLGTKVRLNRRSKGGTITIHYYSDEELNTLIERLIEEE